MVSQNSRQNDCTDPNKVYEENPLFGEKELSLVFYKFVSQTAKIQKV